jgi:hypothetical protein
MRYRSRFRGGALNRRGMAERGPPVRRENKNGIWDNAFCVLGVVSSCGATGRCAVVQTSVREGRHVSVTRS